MHSEKQHIANIGNSYKTLLVIRHAKSSWDSDTISDFERPLNERGKKDAPVMAQRLLDKKIAIDAFVSSPAKRAKKTAELFCQVYNKPNEEIILLSKLYHAAPEIFFETITALEDKYDTVAVFSHNPGISEFVNLLVPAEMRIDNMPTCGIFAVKINTPRWTESIRAEKELLFFDYPKNV